MHEDVSRFRSCREKLAEEVRMVAEAAAAEADPEVAAEEAKLTEMKTAAKAKRGKR